MSLKGSIRSLHTEKEDEEEAADVVQPISRLALDTSLSSALMMKIKAETAPPKEPTEWAEVMEEKTKVIEKTNGISTQKILVDP